MNCDSNRIPIHEGFWTTPASGDEPPRLIGSQCESCGEIYFPRKEKGWCAYCHQKTLKDLPLSRHGKIASFSVVMQQPGGGYYKGPVPYAYGAVELPEGIYVTTLFKADDFDELELHRDVELVMDTLCEDEEGHDIVTFKFMPV